MPSFDHLLAALVLPLCLAGLLRLCLPARWARRVDDAVRGAGRRLARPWRRGPRAAPRPAPPEADADAARREAQAAIHRARTAARREGNVIHPERFRRPRRPH